MKHLILTISLILGITALGAEPIIGKDDVYHFKYFMFKSKLECQIQPNFPLFFS